MTFNIGSQHGQVINNVVGDQRIAGGQHAVQSTVTLADARGAADDLLRLLPAIDLGADTARDADDVGRRIRDELARPEPDQAAVSGLLQHFTRLLDGAGALARTTPLIAPLHALTSW